MNGQKAPGSRTDHQNTDGSYGLVHDGNVAGKLSAYDGYDEQPYKGNNIANYERAKYANGVKVGGHNGGNVSGNSVLILGDKASVTINVADTDDFGAAKKVYDLDAGERDVTISATPALASYAAGGETGDKNLTDDVTMTVTIPKGLTYETGTASKTPTSIVNNADGTTTLTFDYKNAPVGELIEAVTLKAYIGNPGAEDDAVNNQQFTVTAHVFSRMDPSNSGAHASTTSFRVVRLAALSISKRVSSETSNVNASFDWVLRVSNTSRTDTHHAALADVLPFDGDGRGTRIAGNAPVLTSVEIDLSHAPRTKSSMTRLSSVMSVVSANVSASWPQDVLSNRSTDGTLPSATTSWPLSAAVASGDVMTFDTSASNARGIYVALGDLCAHEYVTITLHMGYPHGGELNGSTMSNQFIQVSDDQPADVASNVVTHRAESVTISIRKVWADGDDESGRPAQGIVASVTGTDGSTRRVNLDKAGNWSAEMTLPAFDDSGERVTYSVAEEGQVPGYLPGIVTGDQLSGYVITNELDVVGMPLSGGHGLTGIFVAASCFVIIAAMVVVIRRQRHAMHGQGA